MARTTNNLRLTGRGLALAATAGVVATVGAACGWGAQATASAASARIARIASGTTVSVTSAADGPKVPVGFLGISMEYRSLEDYVGGNPGKVDPAFVQLLRNLAPTGTSVLRVGGDSTDWTWWPVPGLKRPGGAKFNLTPQYAALLKAVAQEVHAKLLLGINFEADSRRVAAYEERQLVGDIGMPQIDAFELGNEPELYSAFSWYKTPAGKAVLGRPPGYTAQSYIKDYANIASALPKERLAGPDSSSTGWLNLSEFLRTQPRLSLVTVHTYPLKHCGPGAHPTEADLFAPSSLQVLASEVAGWVQIASARHLPLRVDEMNSVTCGGYLPVSGSFGPALWALNILPMYAEAGTVGVNFHTVPFTWQGLLEPVDKKPVSMTNGSIGVQPEYYGLLAFAKLAPPGSQMLKTSVPTDDGLFEWADRTPSGQEHVVVTNPSRTAGDVTLSVPSQTSPGTVEMLRSNGLSSTAQPTLGGQSLSPGTGQLVGRVRSTIVKATGPGHTYRLHLPAASAAILSFGAGST